MKKNGNDKLITYFPNFQRKSECLTSLLDGGGAEDLCSEEVGELVGVGGAGRQGGRLVSGPSDVMKLLDFN